MDLVYFLFRYIYPASQDGESQTLNPEVRSGGPRPTIIKDQLFALTTITNRLRLAFNGQDVDWIDTGKQTGVSILVINKGIMNTSLSRCCLFVGLIPSSSKTIVCDAN